MPQFHDPCGTSTFTASCPSARIAEPWRRASPAIERIARLYFTRSPFSVYWLPGISILDFQISFIGQSAILWSCEPHSSARSRFRPCKTGLPRCSQTPTPGQFKLSERLSVLHCRVRLVWMVGKLEVDHQRISDVCVTPPHPRLSEADQNRILSAACWRQANCFVLSASQAPMWARFLAIRVPPGRRKREGRSRIA